MPLLPLPIRVVFFGTPEFAVPSLQALHADPQIQVVGVVTRPPAKVGRKRELVHSVVQQVAQEHHVDIATPTKLKDPDFVSWMKTIKPDVAVLASYGKILPQVILDIPAKGFVNVHPSLLPLHRGASPVAGAILTGDQLTGVSIMLLDAEMDHGALLAQKEVSTPPDATRGSLSRQLSELGAQLLVPTLCAYMADKIKGVAQQHEKATFTKLLKREDGEINWSAPALEIERKVRAFDPWPGTFTCLAGVRIKIIAVSPNKYQAEGAPGSMRLAEDVLVARAKDGWLALDKIQYSGKRVMSGADFARGHRSLNGAQLGSC